MLVSALLVLLAIWRMHSLVQQRWRSEQALQAEKEHMQVILASIGDAVLALNAQGRLLYHNPAAARLLAKPELAAGTPVNHLFDIQIEDQPGSTRPLAERLLSQDWRAGDEPLAHPMVLTEGTRIPGALAVSAHSRGEAGTGGVLGMVDQGRDRAFLHGLAWVASLDVC